MDLAFKAIFVLMFLGLLAALRRVARRLRARPDGRVNQMEHELPVLRIIRPVLGIVFYLALFDWLLPGTRLAWAQHGVPLWAGWVGAVGCIGGLGLAVWSLEAMGRHYHGGVGLWDDHELVRSGPYAVIRHPIYAAFVVIMLGLWAMSGSWAIGGSGVLLTALIPVLRLRTEERELRERFGTAYAEYEARTARFIPWLC